MKLKITLLALFFITGCGQTYHSTLIAPEKISGTPKIKIGQIDCDDIGGKAILEESLKEEFQKKGYIITDSNADMIISGSVTIGKSPWDWTPAVLMAVVYFKDSNGLDCGLIKSKTGWVNSVSPESFAKKIVKKIYKNLQKK